MRNLPIPLAYASTSGCMAIARGRWCAKRAPWRLALPHAPSAVDAEAAVSPPGPAGAATFCAFRHFTRLTGRGNAPGAPASLGTPVLGGGRRRHTNHIHAGRPGLRLHGCTVAGRAQRAYHISDGHMQMGAYFDLAADLYGCHALHAFRAAPFGKNSSLMLLSFMS